MLYPENSCQIHVFYSNFCFRSLRVWSLLRRPLILLGWFLCPVQHKPRPRPVPLHVEDPPAQHCLLTRPFLCTTRSWRPCEGRSAACSRACWWARCSGRGVPAPRPCAPSLRPVLSPAPPSPVPTPASGPAPRACARALRPAPAAAIPAALQQAVKSESVRPPTAFLFFKIIVALRGS